MKKWLPTAVAALFTVLCLWHAPSSAATLLPNGEQTFVDANGAPLAAGSVYFYIPNTTTFKTTWIDSGQVTSNANPVVLDSAGRAIIYGSGVYRQVVKDQFGSTVWDQLTASADSVANVVDTRAAIATTHIPTSIKQISVFGYTTLYDGPQAFYKSVGSDPADGLGIQDADGHWWDIDMSLLEAQQLGCKSGSSGFDNTPCINRYNTYINSGHGRTCMHWGQWGQGSTFYFNTLPNQFNTGEPLCFKGDSESTISLSPTFDDPGSQGFLSMLGTTGTVIENLSFNVLAGHYRGPVIICTAILIRDGEPTGDGCSSNLIRNVTIAGAGGSYSSGIVINGCPKTVGSPGSRNNEFDHINVFGSTVANVVLDCMTGGNSWMGGGLEGAGGMPITAIQNDGSGHIQLVVPTTSNFANGQTVVVAGAPVGTNANGGIPTGLQINVESATTLTELGSTLAATCSGSCGQIYSTESLWMDGTPGFPSSYLTVILNSIQGNILFGQCLHCMVMAPTVQDIENNGNAIDNVVIIGEIDGTIQANWQRPVVITGHRIILGSSNGIQIGTLSNTIASGNPTLSFPNTSGTLAASATAPIVLDAVTGAISCPTCSTGAGGPLIGVAPVNVTGANISIVGLANGVSAGATGAFTTSPTLGTSLTVPLLIGGTTTNQTMVIESTSGAGSTDLIQFKTGAQVVAGSIQSTGNWDLGTHNNQVSQLDAEISSTITSSGYTQHRDVLTIAPVADSSANFTGFQVSATRTTNVNTTGQNLGTFSYVQNSGSGTDTLDIGLAAQVLNSGGGVMTKAQGINNLVLTSGTSTIATADGMFNEVESTVAAGTAITTASGLRNIVLNQGAGNITTAYANNASIVNNSTGTVTTAYGTEAIIQNNNAAGTFTTAYGLHTQLVNPGITTNWYGLRIEAVSGNAPASVRAPIYSADTGPSTLSGNLTATGFIPSGSTVLTNGMYLSGANTLDFSTGSTKALEISNGQVATFTQSVNATSFIPTGSAPTNGFYLNGANNPAISANGSKIVDYTSTTGENISTGGLAIGGTTVITSSRVGQNFASITSTTFIPTSASAPTNGLYLAAANNPAIAENSTESVDFSSTGFNIDTGALLIGTTSVITSGRVGQNFTGMTSSSYTLTALFASNTAPTINTGFCTSPSITNANGTAGFDLTIGSACGAGTGTLNMPAAAHKWNCKFNNETNNATSDPEQTGGTSTTVTVQNYVRTTGVAGNFTAADVIRASCVGY